MLKRVWRKREHFGTIGGNLNWYSHYREQYGGSLKKLKIELPYEPVIPLLVIYAEKMKTDSKKYMKPSVYSSTVYNS